MAFLWPSQVSQVQTYTSDSTDDARCARCGGRGTIPAEAVTLAYLCQHCDGTGRVWKPRDRIYPR